MQDNEHLCPKELILFLKVIREIIGTPPSSCLQSRGGGLCTYADNKNKEIKVAYRIYSVIDNIIFETTESNTNFSKLLSGPTSQC